MSYTVYERLYVEAFAQRTFIAIAYLLATSWLLIGLLNLLAGSLNWLCIGGFVYNFITCIPFILVLLSRLRLIANPDKYMGRIFNLTILSTAALWVLSSGTFLYVYFSTFAPSYLILYTHPEGKYGPPLLREQPFFLASFSLFFGVVAYARLAWKYNVVPFRLDSTIGIIAIAIKRMKSSFHRLLKTAAYALSILFIENLMFGPVTMTIFSTLRGSLHPLRRPTHSFWEFFDPRLFYHLVWCAAALCIMYLAIDVITEQLFGCCYGICRNTNDPSLAILSGLKSTRTAVRNQALLELRNMMIHEVVWRESFFRDFEGEEALSRGLCTFFITALCNYRDHLNLLNKDLGQFGREFEKYQFGESLSNNRQNSSSQAANRDKSIFSPRKPNVIEGFLSPITSSVSLEDVRKDDGEEMEKFRMKQNAIPDILEIKPAKSTVFLSEGGSLFKKPSTSTSMAYNNGYVEWTLLAFKSFAHTFPGRLYAALSIEMIKAWWLGHEEPYLWLIDCLASFITASYDEDVHGQVQFALNDLIKSLLELSESLKTFDKLPMVGERSMLTDLLGPTPPPTERRVHTIMNMINIALDSVMEKFSDSLDQLKLESSTRERLRSRYIN